MLVFEFKAYGNKSQFTAVDEAIRTAQFVRNSCLRYWMDNKKVDKYDLNKYCAVLAGNFPFASELNSQARQASAERAWSAISRFHENCKKGIPGKKGYPKFQKDCRSVEYKSTGWKLAEDRKSIKFIDKKGIGRFKLKGTRDLHFYQISQIKRVRLVKRASGVYVQFCIDVDRKENTEPSGNTIGLDVGLKEYYTDSNGVMVENPKFLLRSEKVIKRCQRRISRKVKGSLNRGKARQILGKRHLKISRQRKDHAIKLARCVVQSNDLIAYEDLRIKNMVKNHCLAKSILVFCFSFVFWFCVKYRHKFSMNFDSPVFFDKQPSQLRMVRPIGVLALHGIAFLGNRLFAVDRAEGLLLEIDRESDNTTVLNPCQTAKFAGATGLAIEEDTIWFARGEDICCCRGAIRDGELTELKPEHFVSLAYPADGIAVWKSTLYVTCQRQGYILVFDCNTGREITRFYAPGIGVENITVRDEELWVCDKTEQTVYCLERANGDVKFSILTPFENPSGLAFHKDSETGEEVLYVAYAGDELYIRDDPNSEDPFQLTKRDRTFIHPLYFHYNEAERYALSNGFLMEMSYVEELSPLDDVEIDNLEWRIALPSQTHRQKVRQITPIGMPFTEEIYEGERVAVFKFDRLHAGERRIFGWKALLEVRAIKYQLLPRNLEKIPKLSPEFEAKYLVDNDNLAMDTEIVRSAATAAIGSETNILRKLLSIRNFVYDQLSYGIRPHIDTPDIVLRRGVGSCGEYVGLLLALARLNGIACRTIGRYKCPAFADRKGLPLEPDFNHVWLEFYIPGFGWVPMESNPDDIQEKGPYPLRFFMGLAWYHVEIGKGIRFQSLTSGGLPLNKENVSVGTLAINHVRFTILSELPAI